MLLIHQMIHQDLLQNLIPVPNTTTTSTPAQTSEVNAVQSSSSQQPGGKKKKGKSKKSSNEQDNPKSVDTQPTRKPKFPCMICEEDHYTKYCPHREAITKYLKGTSQPVQQQHSVAQNPVPPQGGDPGHSHHGDASTSASEVYMFKTVNVTTRANTYDTPPGDKPNGKAVDQPSNSTPPPSSNPLQIEKPISDAVLRPPKSVIRKVVFNPNACAAQKYNIVEDLAQAPCAMSTLEVLQHCPNQCRTLLSAIGAMDPEESNLITFNLDYFKERVSHHLAFQIQVFISEHTIHRTVLDEGASTCVMSFPCWRALGSPSLISSPTTLKAFDGHGFQPHIGDS
jgi:hypothetical protein